MPAQPERWVLDTNAVLDWLVFDDVHMRAAAAALHAGHALWLHSQAMLDELHDVLAREVVTRRVAASPDSLRQRAQAAARRHGLLQAPAPRCAWRCADADDQMFLDLARHAGASVLVTRDKALLAFAHAALADGLRILRPAELAAPGLCGGLRPAAAGAAPRQ